MADIRTRASRYSNPRLGAAFENLADVFAPPSGTDLYGYTRAAAEKQKMQRLGDLWSARDSMSQDQFDRAVAATGQGNIASGYYGVNTKAATDARGQDIQSGDNRYNVDSRDRTSRANNSDDNRTRVVTTYGTPIPKDAYRTGVPKEVADLYGIPAIPDQRGVIAAQPGERNVLPDGTEINGVPKPKTKSEVEGDHLATMTKEQLDAIVFGNTPVVETGNGPMTRPKQLQTGTPEIDKTQPQAFNSKRGALIWDPVKRAYVPAPGVDGPLQSPSAAVGSEGALGPTKANIGASHTRSAEDTTALNTLDLYETLVRKSPGSFGVVGAIRGTAQDAVASAHDLAAAFGDKAPQVHEAAQAVRAGLQTVAPELFDPSIPEADFLRGTLAYAIARTENPSGEVSRQAYANAYSRLGGGMLANQSSILAQIGAYRKVLQAKQAGTGVLQGATPRTDTGYQPPAAPAARPRATDANGNMIEYDGQAWVPVK
jgi:hypothetical protein